MNDPTIEVRSEIRMSNALKEKKTENWKNKSQVMFRERRRISG